MWLDSGNAGSPTKYSLAPYGPFLQVVQERLGLLFIWALDFTSLCFGVFLRGRLDCVQQTLCNKYNQLWHTHTVEDARCTRRE